MLAYFSKDKMIWVNEGYVNVDEELRTILLSKKVWSNIDLDDLFQSYLRKMSLINHFSGQEDERDYTAMSKLRQIASILKGMGNCYFYADFTN